MHVTSFTRYPDNSNKGNRTLWRMDEVRSIPEVTSILLQAVTWHEDERSLCINSTGTQGAQILG